MTAQPSRPLRILLADDNLLNQRLALLVLARAGYSADVVANGQEVLEAVARKPYDVVLMDVQMPGMDGLEATRRLRADGHDLLIVAVTADDEPGAVQACIDAGMDSYLPKPLDVEALVRVLGGEVARLSEATEVPGVLDRRVLDRLTAALGGAGPALARTLLVTFLDETPDLVLKLQAAVDAADAELARRAAHTLKSNAAALGANRLAAVCRDAEARAAAGQLTAVAGLLDELRAEHERACAVIRLRASGP